MHKSLQSLLKKKSIYEDYLIKVIDDNHISFEEVEEFKEIYDWKIEENTCIDENKCKDPIRLFLASIAKIKMLSAEEEIRLLKKYKLTWDINLKNKIVESNLRLVVSIAKKYIWHNMSFLDLISDWILWLSEWIDRFDQKHWTRLSTYSIYWIEQFIRKSISCNSHWVSVPVHVTWEMSSIDKVLVNYFNKNWKEMTAEELRAELEKQWKKIWIKRLKIILSHWYTSSLDKKIWDDNENTLWDVTEDKQTDWPDEVYEKKVLSENINNIINNLLNDIEKNVILMRFWIWCTRSTLEQVWDQLDITRERVRQIEKRAIQKIKEHPALFSMIWGF